MRCSTLALVALLAPPTAAQLTLTATTTGSAGMAVDVNGTGQSIAPGTDVSNGALLSMQDPACALCTAETELVIVRESRVFTTLLTSSAATGPGGFFSTSADAGIQLAYASATPLEVDVEVTLPRFLLVMITCSGESNSASIVGGPGWSSQPDCPLLFPDFDPCTFTYPATIDANGLVVDITANANAITNPFGICPGGGTGDTFVEVRVVRRGTASRYGFACGVDLQIYGDLLDPTMGSLTVDAAPGTIFGSLLFGTTQQAVTLPWGCVLYVDGFFDIPFLVDSAGDLSAAFPLPPLGLLTTQAATTDGLNIAMSQGWQL